MYFCAAEWLVDGAQHQNNGRWRGRMGYSLTAMSSTRKAKMVSTAQLEAHTHVPLSVGGLLGVASCRFAELMDSVTELFVSYLIPLFSHWYVI